MLVSCLHIIIVSTMSDEDELQRLLDGLRRRAALDVDNLMQKHHTFTPFKSQQQTRFGLSFFLMKEHVLVDISPGSSVLLTFSRLFPALQPACR